MATKSQNQEDAGWPRVGQGAGETHRPLVTPSLLAVAKPPHPQTLPPATCPVSCLPPLPPELPGKGFLLHLPRTFLAEIFKAKEVAASSPVYS